MGVTFVIGALSGAATVLATQPLECALLRCRAFSSPQLMLWTLQCRQNSHAVARGQEAVPQLVPLHREDLQRGATSQLPSPLGSRH